MMTVLALASLLAALDGAQVAQADAPPPATTPPPVLKLEGTTTGTTAPAPAATPAPPKPADVPLAPGSRGAPVYLTIQSNRTDALLLRSADDSTACTPPCKQLVKAGPKDIYLIGGPGIASSKEFDFADGIKAATLEVHAGSKGARLAGIILFAVGVPCLLSGGLEMASWGILQDPAVQAQIQANQTQTVFTPALTLALAIIYLAVGTVATTLGLVLWPLNTTTVTVKPTELPDDATPPPSEPPPAVAPQPAGT